MAIDGTGIIDSDMAHDIYIYVRDEYKDGMAVNDIIKEVLSWQSNMCGGDEIGEVYTEIYWTAFAYSL